jgi:hypothetical protein
MKADGSYFLGLSKHRLVLNFLAFYGGWFACVLGGAHGKPWLGVAATIVVVIVHLGLSYKATNELKIILVMMIVGSILDGALSYSGWLIFAGSEKGSAIPPVWMIALWALFATSLNVSLRWLRGKNKISILLGALAGPFSYYGGSKLGGLMILDPVKSFLALSVIWAILMPLLIKLSIRWDGAVARHEQPTLRED